MNKIKEAMRKMMYGRYGIDHLGRDGMWLSIIVLLLYNITRFAILGYASIIILVILYTRMFSKQHSKRYEENRKYMNWRTPMTRKLNKIWRNVVKFWKQLKDLPKYKYLRCPECKTQMRVPRGKKNIVVTCPSCRHKFDAKS